MERNTLAQLVSQRSQSQEDNQTRSFNTFLTVYSINLAHRYPDVADLNKIDSNSVRKISTFSAVCSTIALETWDELYSDQQRRRAA